ncbi:MAG: hypothetical protein HC938_05645 [Nitrospira sp.]|nr:hypothetical protein [Nitrospira sp.]
MDDSAVVIMALSKLKLPEHARDVDESLGRGMRWVLAMQGSDGGWGAYDKDNNRVVFNYIPFADHKALLDPSTADLAGRCLEMLGALGYDKTHPAAVRALAFLKKEQEEDGSWYGRWGVNYIYGTWSVLAGLRAIGEDLSATYIQRAVSWLESKQNPDGGWGESCLSYNDFEHHGQGDSMPSQTAWALMALMSAGAIDSFSVARGVQFLLRHQKRMDVGKRLPIPAPDSLGYSTFGIIGIVSISPCGPWRCIGTSVHGGRCGPMNFAITSKGPTRTGLSIDRFHPLLGHRATDPHCYFCRNSMGNACRSGGLSSRCGTMSRWSLDSCVLHRR